MKNGIKELFKIIICSAIALVGMDLFVSLSLGFEYEPSENKIKNYFSYGVSTHRKLINHVGESPGESISIANAGWNNSPPLAEPSVDVSCEKRLTVYGMSFTNRIRDHLKQINHCYSFKTIAGPGAPLSHSYFMLDKYLQNDDSEIVILGVLASSLPKINSMAHFTSSFEFPGAHLYPRYYVDNEDTLYYQAPPARHVNEFREIITTPHKLAELKLILREHDSFYHDFVFGNTWIDYSNTGKMFRRSFAQKNKREVLSRYYENGRFTNHEQFREIATALLLSFVEKVRSSDKQIIVILLNDNKYSNALDELFQKRLDDVQVKYVTSSDLIDVADPTNFESDGHFTTKNDLLLANQVDNVIQSMN